MTKLISTSIILALLSVGCDTPKECTDEPIGSPKIILIVGQSNTHAGIGYDETLDAPSPNIYQLGRFDNDQCIIQACEPLDHHTKVENMIGFGLTFSKLMSAHLNESENILIVPCGYGGTGFADGHWNQGNDLYQDAIDRTNSLRIKHPSSEIVAVLWHKGETDVILENQNYQADLDSFIVNLRSDIGNDSIPFILGGMVPYWVDQALDRQQFQQIIMQTPQQVAMTGYVDPEIPFRINKPDDSFDEIHFDAAGQRELGQRYFYEYVLLTE